MRRSTAASATGSRSASTTPTASPSRATLGLQRRLQAQFGWQRHRCAPTRPTYERLNKPLNRRRTPSSPTGCGTFRTSEEPRARCPALSSTTGGCPPSSAPARVRPMTWASATTTGGGSREPDRFARLRCAYRLCRRSRQRLLEHPYRQFNVTAVSGPSYNSRCLNRAATMRGCPDNRVDIALSRDIRMGGTGTLEFRLDVFNLFNTRHLRSAQTTR